DEGSYFLTKQPFNMDYIGPVASDVTNAIKATLGFTKKCLVLDLDNTLWGGVVGDEGPLGINVDPNNALGEAYRHFQKYILSLKNRGVILAVNSKNDEEIAREPFEQNPDMLLKLDDFAAFVANWEDKASNLRLIAETLNIGIDSLVFFDDNPAEREIVRSFCPEVTVIDVPEAVEAYADALDRADAFRWAQITKEDMERSASYTENRHRDELRHNFVNYDEYLTALEMKGKCDLVGDDEADRFTQLINKSNQFNLRTQRYSSGEIDSIRNDGEHALVYVSLTDKFTSYGIISCIILEKRGEDIFIDTWCMSCRVLKRSVEDFAFKHLIEIAKNLGGKRLIGEYLPTKKNGMVRDFYQTLGFTQKDGETEGTLYEYDLSKEYTKEIFITKEA
ncbi:MAG: HAD-IIIC family phosphatase, partial [Lachnospiraceae bacterium]|nr:HAD-IIIC family phosphatase [Lachnospiraceae bacterium]